MCVCLLKVIELNFVFFVGIVWVRNTSQITTSLKAAIFPPAQFSTRRAPVAGRFRLQQIPFSFVKIPSCVRIDDDDAYTTAHIAAAREHARQYVRVAHVARRQGDSGFPPRRFVLRRRLHSRFVGRSLFCVCSIL
jgi:hypothetical protein